VVYTTIQWGGGGGGSGPKVAWTYRVADLIAEYKACLCILIAAIFENTYCILRFFSDFKNNMTFYVFKMVY